MSKRVYQVSDAQMRRDRETNKKYTKWAENVDANLKKRYGDNYKCWPDDYDKKVQK